MPDSSTESAPKGRPPSRRGTGSPRTPRAEEALEGSLEEAAANATTASEGAEGVPEPRGGVGTKLAALRLEALSARATYGDVAGSARKLGLGFWLAVAWIGLVVFAAVFANVLPIVSPNKVLAGPPNEGPSWHHLFGTDLIGHDLFSQVVAGARISMLIGATSVAVGLVVGGGLGVLAGFYRGVVDVVVVWVTDVLLTLPGLILALTFVAFLGQSLENVILAIDLLSIPAYARIARATSFTVSQREFVLTARALGARPRRILFRDVVPLVAIPIASFAAIGASIAILAEGALAFLGLSSPNSLSWGGMIAEGQQQLSTAPQVTFAPMIAFFLTIMALNYIGQKAGTALDPRQARL